MFFYSPPLVTTLCYIQSVFKAFELHMLAFDEKEGIIEIKYYGRVKMIELETDNPKTHALLKALHLLNRSILPQDRNQ